LPDNGICVWLTGVFIPQYRRFSLIMILIAEISPGWRFAQATPPEQLLEYAAKFPEWSLHPPWLRIYLLVFFLGNAGDETIL
jgi:hypothetical protein